MKLRNLNNPKKKTPTVVGKIDLPAKKKRKSKPKAKPKATYEEGKLLPLSLALEISDNFKGIADSIGGVLNDLPAPIKMLASNAEIKTTVNKAGYSMFVLDNGLTIKLTHKRLGNKPFVEVEIKQGKKRILTKTIK